MPITVALGTTGLLFEAEVAPNSQARFEKRYLTATKQAVTPGTPDNYQNQPGKWGTELRIYFNDSTLAAVLEALSVHVEYPRKGYKAGKYKYRINDSKLWWQLVESYGLKLVLN